MASVDDGNRSGIIAPEDLKVNQTMPKPGLLTETRGPRGLTEAALQLFPGQTSAPTAEIILKVSQNFEKLYELNGGEATVGWINKHCMKVPDWAQADADDYDDIHNEKECREANGLLGGCSIANPNGGLYLLMGGRINASMHSANQSACSSMSSLAR